MLRLLTAALAPVLIGLAALQPARAQTPDGAAVTGWAACTTPVHWVADMSALTPAQASRETARLQQAFATWSRATGLQFAYAGQVAAALDPGNPTPRLADGGRLPERTILITYTTREKAPMLSEQVYAYAAASLIYPDRGEIVGGYAVVRADLPAASGRKAAKRMRNLYLHELGHVLGLTHNPSKASIMYPTITDTIALSGEDADRARALDRPCLSA